MGVPELVAKAEGLSLPAKLAVAVAGAVVVIGTAAWVGYKTNPDTQEREMAESYGPEWKAAARASLKDPDSAKFREIRVSPKGQILCGEVNAKNGFGGYTGFDTFAYSPDRGFADNLNGFGARCMSVQYKFFRIKSLDD